MSKAKITTDPEFQNLIPPLSASELKALEENILENGCRDPLVTWQGVLLDGHNRLTICGRHDIDFSTVEAKGIQGRDDAKAWIIKNQLGRRNLDESQRALLAVALQEIFAVQSRQRYEATQIRNGKPPGLANLPTPDEKSTVPANLPEPQKKIARNEAAAVMNVSPRLVQSAKKVVNNGTEKLRVEVMSGRVAVSAAAEVATLPKKKQDEIVANGPKAIAKAASEIRRKRKTDSTSNPPAGKARLSAKQLARLAELVVELKKLTDVPKMEYSPITIRECVAQIVKIVL